MTDDFRADFLGAFAIVRRGEHVLLVGNERTIGGRVTVTWDLPGGRVERAELLLEALRREVAEETGLRVRGEPRLAFVQEGERRRAGRRVHAWRSFFFEVDVEPGEPSAANEVVGVRWVTPAAMQRELTAPYHDSFREWLRGGGTWFSSRWDD
jgi:8-oxo-dGTP diphosphatase